VQITAFGLT